MRVLLFGIESPVGLVLRNFVGLFSPVFVRVDDTTENARASTL